MRAVGIDTEIWLQHAWRNRLQSLVLLAAMGGFLALLGWLLWGDSGIVMLLAHEISHIRNNDLWVMGLADMVSRTTSVLSLVGQLLLLLNLPLVLFSAASINWFAIALLVFAPHLSALAQLALSRTREYDADLNAARLTGDPEGLARALARIERAKGAWWERIFLPGRRMPDPSLLRTHPDTAARIERLMALRPETAGLEAFSVAGPVFDVGAAFGKPVARRPRWHVSGLWH